MKIASIVLGLWLGLACIAAGQDENATAELGPGRIERIALRGTEPEGLSGAARRDLATIHAALASRDSSAAMARWREFTRRRGDLGTHFDVEIFVDHVLHRLASARDPGVAAAGRKLLFYDRQEAAAREHVSTVDKQLSAYSGEDNPQMPLREPELAEYGDEVEPVRFPAGAPAGVKEMRESLARWRERLPDLTEARGAALAEFERALRGNAALMKELVDVETALRT